MVKKATKFANLAQGGQFTVKDPADQANDKKNAKKKKPNDGKKSSQEFMEIDSNLNFDKMLKMLKNDENENTKNTQGDLDMPVITD